MKTLKELRARLHAIHERCQALTEQDELTAEESTEFDTLISEADEVKASIKQLERFEALDQGIQVSRGRQTTPQPAARIEGGQPREELDPWRGFQDAGDFALAVKGSNPKSSGAPDERLLNIQAAPSNFHQERGSDEGYMVPPAMRDEIWDVVNDTEDMLSEVDDEPTNSNAVQMIKDETTPWGSSGVSANWASEGSQLSASKLSTKAQLVQLHKLYVFSLGTDELLADAPRLADRLTRKAGLAIGWKVSDAIFYGTGAGQPLGFFNSPALVTQGKEASQAADTLNAKNIAKMFSRCLNPQRAKWHINQDVFPELATLTLGNQPIWVPPTQGFAQSPGGLLLGRPVMITEHCKTLGDNGDVVLMDGMGYYSPRKEGNKFASSIHLFFDYDVEAFRWTFRFGGQPYLSAPVTPANGTNTRSHFVTLAERA